jgi:oligopeptide transport system ATP-binding protein
MNDPAGKEPLLKVRELHTHFYDGSGFLKSKGAIRAVDGVDLEIDRGEIVGLVGESGSGKTTIGRTILRLAPRTSGEVIFDGTDVFGLEQGALRKLRRRMQVVFQDPHASLSPRLSVSYLISEPYRINKTPASEQRSVEELLEMVELSPELASKKPAQLSGGQARRVGIARALAHQPDLLVADEPTAGLDISAAAQMLNLIKDLSRNLGLACMVITHNLDVVGYVADRIAVMYLGVIVEIGPTDSIFDSPAHPYTQALINSVPEVGAARTDGERRLLLPGEIPSPKDVPSGCRFRTRCAHATEQCAAEVPVLEPVGPGHDVACLRWRDIPAMKPDLPMDAPQGAARLEGPPQAMERQRTA